MSDLILTLNAGSSSLKFAIFASNTPSSHAEMTGKFASIGRQPVFTVSSADGRSLDKGALATLDNTFDHEKLLALLLPWLAQHHGRQRIAAVGHRVVHGGERFEGPTRVTEAVLDELERLVPLAPLHQPHNLAAIRAVAEWRPDLLQIACFDTSFHRTQERLAQLFAIPHALSDEGVIRYGFHGLSYAYIAGVLPEYLGPLADRRVIVAHLGNGSSLCAMKERQSMATSMGFTALDGLVMGRRCGTLDPGVILYLMRAKKMDATAIEDMLYRKSGLLGVSGISNNMHVLQESKAPRAREAIELYCYRAAGLIAGLVPSIGGLDALVFTAGIGENSALVRQLICDRLAWLGVSTDSKANSENAVQIGSEQSCVKVLVLPTNEEAIIAKACRDYSE